jgi:hypothetical protein
MLHSKIGRLKIILKELSQNYYYLVAGILAIIFSIRHAWNGQTIVLPSLNIDAINSDTKTILFYVWHIIKAENMLYCNNDPLKTINEY